MGGSQSKSRTNSQANNAVNNLQPTAPIRPPSGTAAADGPRHEERTVGDCLKIRFANISQCNKATLKNVK
ncbi:hypothetical protein FGIG_10913 [Fasciola gigantica]|uniref:Uncharacterized protein n=1 Tax=Fasciola gigantica TaxID=46835 RepID=A0A504Z8J3_FASGI|nr:hypothetical protein FGIG_10913 [Fasciola gigantica]